MGRSVLHMRGCRTGGKTRSRVERVPAHDGGSTNGSSSMGGVGKHSVRKVCAV